MANASLASLLAALVAGLSALYFGRIFLSTVLGCLELGFFGRPPAVFGPNDSGFRDGFRDGLRALVDGVGSTAAPAFAAATRALAFATSTGALGINSIGVLISVSAAMKSPVPGGALAFLGRITA